MHIHHLHRWEHNHQFNINDGQAERNTRRVILLTLSMMIIEITAGYMFGSMALLADGWHEAGDHGLQWDGRSEGRSVGAGVYLLRISTPEETLTHKVMLIK